MQLAEEMRCEATITKLRTELKHQTHQHELQIESVQLLKDELALVNEELSTMEKVGRERQLHYQEQEVLLLEYRDQIEVDSKKLSDFESSKSLSSEINLESSDLQFEIVELENKCEQQRAKLVSQEKKYEKLEETLKSIQQEMLVKDTQLFQKQNCILTLEKDLETCNEKLSSSYLENRRVINDLNQQVGEFESELTFLRTEKEKFSVLSVEMTENSKLLETKLSETEYKFRQAVSQHQKYSNVFSKERKIVQDLERKLHHERKELHHSYHIRENDQKELFRKQLSLCSSAIKKSHKYFEKFTSATTATMEQYHDDAFVVMTAAKLSIQLLRKDLITIKSMIVS